MNMRQFVENSGARKYIKYSGFEALNLLFIIITIFLFNTDFRASFNRHNDIRFSA